MYKTLKESVNEEVFNEMELNFSYMLDEWNNQCDKYNNMTDEEIGECGENLSRFQIAVFGSNETIEEYLQELK